MPGFNDIVKRLGAVWHIAFNNPARLSDLGLTPKGFWESFWAIPIAFLTVFLGRLFVLPNHFGGLFINSGLFINICVWIGPLMMVVALCDVFGIRDRIIPFVVSFNWLQAFLQLGWMVLLPFVFILPPLIILFMAAAVFISYRVFRTALHKSVLFTIIFMVFYFIMKAVVFAVAADVAGLPILEIMQLPPEAAERAVQGSLL